jgi:hypothetical protein
VKFFNFQIFQEQHTGLTQPALATAPKMVESVMNLKTVMMKINECGAAMGNNKRMTGLN